MDSHADLSTFTPGERAILRRLDRVLDALQDTDEGIETTMSTVAEQVTAALAGDEQAIHDLASRVAERDTKLEQVAAGLEATLAEMKAKGLDPAQVAEVEAHLKAIKTQADAIDPAAPVPPAAPEKSVYTFTPGEGVVADERFTASAFETAPTDGSAPVALEYFSGDTAPGETNGQFVAGYAVYSGAVQAAPVA